MAVEHEITATTTKIRSSPSAKSFLASCVACVVLVFIFERNSNAFSDFKVGSFDTFTYDSKQKIRSARLYGANDTFNDSLAILAYIPTNEKFIREVRHMLHPSWHYSVHMGPELGYLQSKKPIRRTVDLILFVDPSIANKMPPDCIKVPYNFKQYWLYRKNQGGVCYVIQHVIPRDNFFVTHRYSFMNSILYVKYEAYKKWFESYSLIMRTDCDCFISPALMYFRPLNNSFTVGNGWYGINSTYQRLQDIALKLKYSTLKEHGIGSTWIGDPKKIIEVANLTTSVGKYLLLNEFDGKRQLYEHKRRILSWPEWHRGVTSLYAADISINHLISRKDLYTLRTAVDLYSYSKKNISEVFHIHCWHSENYFSKILYTQYRPEDFPDFSLINPTNDPSVQDYAVYISLYYSVGTPGTFPWREFSLNEQKKVKL